MFANKQVRERGREGKVSLVVMILAAVKDVRQSGRNRENDNNKDTHMYMGGKLGAPGGQRRPVGGQCDRDRDRTYVRTAIDILHHRDS